MLIIINSSGLPAAEACPILVHAAEAYPSLAHAATAYPSNFGLSLPVSGGLAQSAAKFCQAAAQAVDDDELFAIPFSLSRMIVALLQSDGALSD